MGFKRRNSHGQLISIRDALDQKISRIRRAEWTIPNDHVEITFSDNGTFCAIFKFWSDLNAPVGNNNPLPVLMTQLGDFDDPAWLPYEAK